MLLATAVAAVALGTAPQEVAAKTIQAYLLFELTGSNTAGVVEKLRSTSLGNCKQVLLGPPIAQDVIMHLACDESDDRQDTRYMSQALLDLARVDGVKRATILVVKREA
jgi:hypothetical protein